MGLTKRFMEAQQEQGWTFTDQHVCAGCVDEEALAAALEMAASPEETCDFCGRAGAAPLDALLDPFVVGLRRLYDYAEDELYLDREAEHGFSGPTVDTWDLLENFSDILSGEGLLEAVRDAIDDRTWVPKFWAWPSVDEALSASWDRFCEQIKYDTRYVFWRRSDGTGRSRTGEIPPSQILDAVGQLVDLYPERLYGELATSEQLWRARPHLAGKAPSTASNLGTTPVEKSRTNRMSPAGIPMFYAALDPETARLEATQGTDRTHVTVGAFTTSRNASVLDLTNLRDIPSVFEPDGDERPQWVFLHYFTRSLRAKPELPDIDYVPTQVVTEYFLKVFSDGTAFDGILYHSDVDGGQVCIVLNVKNEQCVERTLGWDTDPDTLTVALDPSTVETRAL